MQLIGHYLVAYAEDGTVTEESFGEALESARDEFENDVCATTLAALSAKDCAYLLSMAKIGGVCRTADVAARMGVSADYGQQYRRRLLDAGVIEAPRKGSVRFAIPYLEDYLRRL